MPRPTGKELAELGKATQWRPGQSGNPSGQNGRELMADLDAALAVEADRKAIAKLWVADAQATVVAPMGDNPAPMVRAKARDQILNRLVGLPTQAIELGADEALSRALTRRNASDSDETF